MLKILSKDIAAYGIIGSFRAFVPFLLLPLLTRYLSTSEFGILSIIEATIVLISPFVLSNIPGAINTEYFHLPASELKAYITNSLILAFVAFLIVTLITVIFLFLFPDFGGISSAISLWIPFLAVSKIVSSVILGVFQMRRETRNYATFVALQTSFDLALTYGLVVLFKMGYLGRLEGMYGTFILTTLAGIFWLKRMDLISAQIVLGYSKKILAFSVPLIPHTLSGAVLLMSSRYFISSIVGKGAVGTYSVAYQIASIMTLIAMAVSQAWHPLLFRLLKDNTVDSISKIKRALSALIVVFIVSGGAIYLVSDYIFKSFIDIKYYEGKEFFPWLLLGCTFQAIYLLFSSTFFFFKKTMHLASITSLFAVINLMLNYLLIKQYGAVGGAYATAITWFAIMLCVAKYSLVLQENTNVNSSHNA